MGGSVGHDDSEELGGLQVTVPVRRIVLLGFILVGPLGPLSLLPITSLLLPFLPTVIGFL